MNKASPGFSLDHIIRMTDNVGILEHCIFATPDRIEGYCTDDNARALQVSLRLNGSQEKEKIQKYIPVYLKFLLWARTKQGFHQDLNPNLTWKNDDGLGEGFGRAMAALAETAANGPVDLALPAALVFDWQSHLIRKPHSARVKAHLIWALLHRMRFKDNPEWDMMRRFSADDGRSFGSKIDGKKMIRQLADEMVAEFEAEKRQDWCWFEKSLTYDNARLPWGLFGAFKATGDKKYLRAGLESLDWLIKKTWDEQKNCFSWIGNKGWWFRGKQRAVFDQQAIDAGSMVEACAVAGEASGKREYFAWAQAAYKWYTGKNILGINLVDERTGGVKDGLVKEGFNPDEGAESVLSYLIAGLVGDKYVGSKK